jgi:hypothetical protein
MEKRRPFGHPGSYAKSSTQTQMWTHINPKTNLQFQAEEAKK